MILALWVSFLALAALLLVLGYFTGDPHYAFVGLFFIFLCGMYVLVGSLEYESGMNVNTTYTYSNGSVSVAGTSITYEQTSYNDLYTRAFGLLLAVSSGFGMALSFFKLKRDGDD
jgi:hypothetical protein